MLCTAIAITVPGSSAIILRPAGDTAGTFSLGQKMARGVRASACAINKRGGASDFVLSDPLDSGFLPAEARSLGRSAGAGAQDAEVPRLAERGPSWG